MSRRSADVQHLAHFFHAGRMDVDECAPAGRFRVGFWRTARSVGGTAPTSGGGTQTDSQSFCYDALSQLV